MLSVTSELGRIEEFFSEVVYPVWPLWLAGVIVLAAAMGYVAYQRGWHRTAAAHPAITGIVVALILAISVPAGYYTISPLFERNTVCEASPIPGAESGSDDCEGVAVAATAGATASPAPDATDVPQGTAAPTAAATAAPATDAPTAVPAFEAQVVTQGEFHGADDFHFGNGQALLIETAPGVYTVRFENFSVRNGPDLFVYLSSNPEGFSDDAINLGGLKGTDGAFNYEVPAGTDISAFKSAIVWCDEFDVLFATAPFAG